MQSDRINRLHGHGSPEGIDSPSQSRVAQLGEHLIADFPFEVTDQAVYAVGAELASFSRRRSRVGRSYRPGAGSACLSSRTRKAHVRASASASISCLISAAVACGSGAVA